MDKFGMVVRSRKFPETRMMVIAPGHRKPTDRVPALVLSRDPGHGSISESVIGGIGYIDLLNPNWILEEPQETT